MTTFATLIKDTKALNKEVSSVLSIYTSSGNRLHTAVCAAMHNAFVGGNPVILSRIFRGLRSNDQVALRQYIRRFHIAVGFGDTAIPGKLDQEVYTSYADLGAVLSFSAKDKGFAMAKDWNKNQKTALAFIEKVEACPEGWLKVFERNNFQDVKTIGDAEVLAAIKTLHKNATEETDRRKLAVSPAVKAMLAKFASMAESMEGQTELKAQDKPETPIKKAVAKPRKPTIVAEAAMH